MNEFQESCIALCINGNQNQNSNLMSILSCLEDIRTANASDSNNDPKAVIVTLRSLLSSSKTDAETLSSFLSNLISNRADEEEEEEELDHNYGNGSNWTITPVAINAARVYLELSRIKGAWGTGWMDVGILRNIEALKRRFGQESRGKSLKYFPSSAGNAKKKSKTDISPNEQAEIEWDDNIMLCALHLSNSISQVLISNDYWNWSKDAKDALMDTSVLALGICSSLSSTLHEHIENSARASSSQQQLHWQTQRKRSVQHATDINQVQYCMHIVKNMSLAIERCLVYKLKTVAKATFNNVSQADQDEMLLFSHNATATPADPKEMVVTFMRAMYPILTYQIDFPNGVKGKAVAYTHGSKLVIQIIKVVAKIVLNVQAEAATAALQDIVVDEVGVMKTPPSKATARTGKSPWAISARKTPKSLRKSIGGVIVAPPSLKMNAMTPRAKRRQSLVDASTATATAARRTNDGLCNGQEPGGEIISVMNIFVGFMQKLSTSKGMEKADVRGRIADLLKVCLVELPLEQKTIFLRFIVKLCRSKVSAHRVFGVEVIGVCFLMTSLWTGEEGITSQSKASMRFESVNGSEKRLCEEGISEFPPSSSSPMEFASPLTACLISQEGVITNELLSTLQERLNDKAPAVRTRAASALCTAIKSAKDIANLEAKSRLEQCILNFKIPLVLALRFRASMDEKATVRRAAIIALVEIILFNNDTSENDDIAVLGQMCNDSSVAVRKSAIDAFVSLHRHEQERDSTNQEYLEAMESSWVDAVLPLIYDSENACAGKVVDSFFDLIINPIVDYDRDGEIADDEDSRSTAKCQSAWRILSRINTASSSAGSSKGGKNALGVVLKKSFEVMEVIDQRSVCVALFKDLHANIIEDLHVMFSQESERLLSDRMIGSWCLLEGITSLYSLSMAKGAKNALNIKTELKKSAIGTEFLVDCWNSISALCNNTYNSSATKDPRYVSTATSCLRVISSFAPMMTEDAATSLSQSIILSLKDCLLGIDIIGSSITALVQITQRLNDSRVILTQTACKGWINKIMRECESILNSFVAPNGTLSSHLDRALFTAGELIMVGFNPSEDANLVQLSTLKASEGADESADNCIRGLRMKPTASVVYLVQSLLLPTLPREGDSRDETIVPNKLRAHAFVTFGKMCLRDEALARGSINIFARELQQEGEASAPAVKSNALLILGDFCIRYTHHVEKFIPLMASCLQPANNFVEKDDSNESIVRHHALLILSNLILQDYIKWKGVLFYRFLAAAVDPDPNVANLAKLLLCGPLLTKQPSLFFNNFVDALFILNGCTAHPMYTKRRKKESDNVSFCAEGLDFFRINNSVLREEIYSLLLDHMSDEEKIGAAARLCKEVLSAATEIKGELRSAANTGVQDARGGGAYSVLSDCFQILISPKMHIGRSSSVDDDVDANISGLSASGPSASQITSARGKLLSKISRKHLMDTVLPILCNLKTIFEKSHSPLLRNLMQYLVCIFRQFKREVNETLASNQTLLKEIQYDTKQFERGERRNDSKLESYSSGVEVTVV